LVFVYGAKDFMAKQTVALKVCDLHPPSPYDHLRLKGWLQFWGKGVLDPLENH